MATVISKNQKNWSKKLPYVMAAYRSSVHSSTGVTPNAMMLGRETVAPLAILYPERAEILEGAEGFVAELRQQLGTSHEYARRSIGVAVSRQTRNYDSRAKAGEIAVGATVYYYHPLKKIGITPKLQSVWTGPWEVTRRISEAVYEIKRGRNERKVVHYDALKTVPLPPEKREELLHEEFLETQETGTQGEDTQYSAIQDDTVPEGNTQYSQAQQDPVTDKEGEDKDELQTRPAYVRHITAKKLTKRDRLRRRMTYGEEFQQETKPPDEQPEKTEAGHTILRGPVPAGPVLHDAVRAGGVVYGAIQTGHVQYGTVHNGQNSQERGGIKTAQIDQETPPDPCNAALGGPGAAQEGDESEVIRRKKTKKLENLLLEDQGDTGRPPGHPREATGCPKAALSCPREDGIPGKPDQTPKNSQGCKGLNKGGGVDPGPPGTRPRDPRGCPSTDRDCPR